MRLIASRPFLWLVLALPGIWILGQWWLTPDAYGYGHAIADSGDWAAWLLMATLFVTPLRLLRKADWTMWLMRRRRDLGVASFAYAAGHLIVYVWNKASLEAVLGEAGSPEILTGWLALALFLPLAVTSNDKYLRALKRSWKKLHRLVYPAAVLTFVHWVLTAFDPTTAYIHIGVLAAVELLRVYLQRRQRVT
ncbi:ferric reductase-like transmembrane domain-containing protein [Aurantiacibacter sp. MUD11]|uniref:ferric reductase-like transmembrane domain-containing protein n=1 Tax=Aurantiacibacter sp. MUD11 TaxID=3003265 RepID=UPI0022AB0ABA|nr:ferric reductase-like transmembrane domain-containing protein [Aurantiacibacter sp. MUD11]WAT16758.1 ferric reductase-like transmembrane domain-containing protein [Aurantiacibacter sp. MUD11]